jgi:anhydro-N-acetylmuramic acid kinase
MNSNVKRLVKITKKKTRRIIGLMSGTSLDGLDVALCAIAGSGGETKVVIEKFETVSFSEDFKQEIRRIFAKKRISFEHLCLLNPYIAKQHASIVLECLERWQIAPSEIDIIASHGQTVYHAPKFQHGKKKFDNATLQIGDGDHIAVATGIITMSDFRQKHVAAGGEGAPLAVYGDYFIFSKRGENRIMLNMGGIGNFTYLPSDLDAAKVFVTDTGTGNTLLDAFSRKLYNEPFDKDGKNALAGKVQTGLLQALKNHFFFDVPFPKTTGPEVFNEKYVENAIKRYGNAIENDDLMATLARFSAETIAEAIQKAIPKDVIFHIYMSGGGMHNPAIVRSLQELLPTHIFRTTDSLHISGDAKEAVLFAILANEALCGGNTHFGNREKVPSVTMGKISFPN